MLNDNEGSKHTVLLLGATSNVGYNFYEKFKNRYLILPVCRNWPFEKRPPNLIEAQKLESTDISKILEKNDVSIVINCIGNGNIDFCEKNQNITEKINLDFSKDLVRLSLQYGFKPIFFSSSMVFDGKKEFYSETDPTCPLNFYGQSKAKADEFIQRNCPNFATLRLTTIIGHRHPFQRSNPVDFILQRLLANEEVSLAHDVIGNLLFLDDVANALQIIIDKNLSGLYNTGGSKSHSRFDLGKIVADCLNHGHDLIDQKPLSYFKTIAPRPLKTNLTNTKIITDSGINFTRIYDAVRDIVYETLSKH